MIRNFSKTIFILKYSDMMLNLKRTMVVVTVATILK